MPKRGTRARSRRTRLGIVLGLVSLTFFFAFRAQATTPDPNLQAASQRLQSFTDVLARFAEIPSMDQALPASQAKLAEAARLAETFAGASDSLKKRLSEVTNDDLANPAAFAAFLEDELSDTYGTGGDAVTIKVSGPNTASDTDDVVVDDRSDNSTPQQLVDFVFEVKLTRDDVAVPLVLPTDQVNLNGGSTGTFPVDFSLRTTPLHFQLDKNLLASPDAGIRAQALYLRTLPEASLVTPQIAPAATVSATAANAPIGSFNTTLGFTDIAVTGDVSFDVDARATLLDPDDDDGPGPNGDERITSDEWATSAFSTLLDAGFVDDPATNAVDAQIRLETTLLEPDALDGPDADTTNDHDARIQLTDASLADGAGASPAFSPAGLGDLADFRNFTAEDAVAAIERLIAFLEGVQATGNLDLDLPFVTGRPVPPGADPATSPRGTFSDALQVAARLRGIVNNTADAAKSLREQVDNPATGVDERGQPTFATATTFAQKLGSSLGLPGTLVP
ncbi:MAG: hypothetical protein M3123_06735, partial [Actinomycetota bacterium]|nr:hypothetical protein [Actinomycetota bacterium]